MSFKSVGTMSRRHRGGRAAAWLAVDPERLGHEEAHEPSNVCRDGRTGDLVGRTSARVQPTVEALAAADLALHLIVDNSSTGEDAVPKEPRQR